MYWAWKLARALFGETTVPTGVLVPAVRPTSPKVAASPPIVTVALLTVATAWLSFRVRRLRPVLEGDPIILVADGRVLERNLRRQRMTVEELGAEARLAQMLGQPVGGDQRASHWSTHGGTGRPRSRRKAGLNSLLWYREP